MKPTRRPFVLRVARASAVILLISTLAGSLSCTRTRVEAWRALAASIKATSTPESTAVIVLFDQDLVELVRAELPVAFRVVPFRHPDVPEHDTFVPAQLGRMYQETSAATWDRPDVWVFGRTGSLGRMKAARFADMAASLQRRRVLRDSLKTPGGLLQFARWVDRPGGVALRGEMARSFAWAESVLAVGIPTPTPITVPFTGDDLRIDPDTLSRYLSMLGDTSAYSIGGCSDVEITMWSAPEKFGTMGPGVVPALVGLIADPDPFVRERVQEALHYATQDERILARTGGEYIKFYDQPGAGPEGIRTWWAKFGRFWAPDSTR